MMILINSGWIPKRSEISGVDMVGGRGFWYVQTLNILLKVCKKKSAMPLIPLEVERQTIYEVPKYGI